MNDLRRAQARYDGREQPGGTPYCPDAVDEALDYVRSAQRAGAPESTYELLCEATRDLAVRQRAASFLGLPPLATTTAIQLIPDRVESILYAIRCIEFGCWDREGVWFGWAVRHLRPGGWGVR